ncbi:MAG TPA: hypothetical protein VJU61_25255 [Polyangiaceae bacterium]|nr:hypothetical protein [Polyangiaceae bacterium]
MLDQTPVRRHVEISAQTGAQLELRLLWFGRALAVRSGCIVHVDRRSSKAGRHVASIAYEMPLPSYARPPRKARVALRPVVWDRELGQEQGSSAGGV